MSRVGRVAGVTFLLAMAAWTAGVSSCGSKSEGGQSEMNDQKQPRKACDPSLKGELTALQYDVACGGGTEPPFQNEYWNNKQPGVYVDIISGVPLFLSSQKFDSGTGWPSFTAPVSKDAVVEVKDVSHGMVRTEVRAGGSGSHLGHVFPDGPEPSGLRYCINSASLRFVPVENLDAEGLGHLKELIAK